ncbi:hypothetical protein LTR09_004401 [Extremus antarcticus]|uniref:Uncharacterized protein n=1 Tax=Extremus antarcticus TaxID=702011 RepID=A0AAJ0DIM9_9PEZI|nr:hypothetical protein LTR09_004401 [Extremus antarcticus]
MSKEYEGRDPLEIAKAAERDLAGSRGQASDSTKESGVDASVENKFPGSEVTYGSAASGAGDNRDMPEGGVNPKTGQNYKAKDFEGVGGPEDKAAAHAEAHGGDNLVRENVRQTKEPQAFVSK